MAVAAVAEIEPLRVAAVQVLHSARELLLRRLDDEVVVRPHQADGVHAPAVAVDALLEEAHEGVAVGIVAEDERAEDAARRDVEEPVRERRAKHARHVPTVACIRPEIADATAKVALLLRSPLSPPDRTEGLTLGLRGTVARPPGQAARRCTRPQTSSTPGT
jgi:hypothetical protein